MNGEHTYRWLLAAAITLGLTFVTGYRLGRFAAEEDFAARPALAPDPQPPAAPTPELAARPRSPEPARPLTATPARGPTVAAAPVPAAAPPAPGHPAPASGPAVPPTLAAAPVTATVPVTGLLTFPPPGFMGSRVFGGQTASPPVRDPRDRPWTLAVGADLRNLAAGKPVTSSDAAPLQGSLSMLTDGVKSCTGDDVLELASGTQYVQVDLAMPCRIDGVGLWHFCQAPRLYAAVQIWISSTADFQDARAVFNNDHQDLLGQGMGGDELYLETHLGLVQMVPQVTGRYVRAYSRGNTSNQLNHYIELEVYGQPL